MVSRLAGKGCKLAGKGCKLAGKGCRLAGKGCRLAGWCRGLAGGSRAAEAGAGLAGFVKPASRGAVHFCRPGARAPFAAGVSAQVRASAFARFVGAAAGGGVRVCAGPSALSALFAEAARLARPARPAFAASMHAAHSRAKKGWGVY